MSSTEAVLLFFDSSEDTCTTVTLLEVLNGICSLIRNVQLSRCVRLFLNGAIKIVHNAPCTILSLSHCALRKDIYTVSQKQVSSLFVNGIENFSHFSNKRVCNILTSVHAYFSSKSCLL